MSQALLIVPIVALILAAITIAVLWYWWSSGRETASEQDAAADHQPGSWQSMIALELRMVRSLSAFIKSRLSGLRGPALGSAAASAVPEGEMIEVLRLYRDLATGGLVVQIGGRRYTALNEMTDAQARRRFLGTAEAMSQFAETGGSSSPASASPPPTGIAAPAASPAPPPGPRPMADEIEEMLQYRLTLTPEMVHRSIHIRPAIDGGIEVEVDGRYFDSVGAVPDEEVRSFLQDIIREWEARK